MKPIIVDTSVLLAFFFGESRAPAVRSLLEKVEQRKLAGYVSAVTLAELVTAFLRKGDYDLYQGVIEKVIETFKVVDVTADVSMLAGYMKARYATARKGFSLADSFICATAYLLNGRLVTYDSEFDRVTEVPVLRPENVA